MYLLCVFLMFRLSYCFYYIYRLDCISTLTWANYVNNNQQKRKDKSNQIQAPSFEDDASLPQQKFADDIHCAKVAIAIEANFTLLCALLCAVNISPNN